MVVGTSTDGQTILVGIAETDLKDLRKGLTKTKAGGKLFGFRTLVVFMGKTDDDILAQLQQQGTERQDG